MLPENLENRLATAVKKYREVLSELSVEEQEKFTEHVLVVHAIYGTTVIEGTRLTEPEAQRALRNEELPEALARDVQEVINVRSAMRHLQNYRGEVTEDLIKVVHTYRRLL
jgi:hypothetical protein